MKPPLQQYRADLERLCRRFHVQRLDVFGSFASGTGTAEKSDIDLLVEFQSLPRGTYSDNYFGLLEALTTLFGQPVDLVVVSTVTNPYLLQSIEQTKALLYAA